MTTDPWTRVVVTTSAARADEASALLWQHGTAAIEEQAAGDVITLLGGFAATDDADRAVLALAASGFADVRTEPVADDGLDGWRAFAEPIHAGPFVLVPAWLEPPAVGEVVLRLEPGRTFGSGSHATTRLVLAALASAVAPGASVLDVGTGSGVLAVAAARLGASSVVGIDVDGASPAVVAANAETNDVAHLVRASCAPLREVLFGGRTFDLVVANLLAPVIVELGADLVRAVAPGGELIVSGLLADRWEASMTSLAPLRVVDVTMEDDWVAVVLHHDPGAAADAP